MTAFRHAVRVETLEVDVSSEDLALALQPRLSDLNRARLLPAIERVLNEVAIAGRHIRIERLDLDLGVFRASTIEREAEERLVAALRSELAHVLGRGPRSLSEAESQRELLEQYLVDGTIPFWATGGPAFSLEDLMLAMMSADPSGVARTVRTLGRHEYVLERIVAQLGETTLHALIRILEPRHAALILDYVGDLEEAHEAEPVLPLGDRELAHLLWVLVTAYLVQDPGSQFNRKSFVKSLLEGLAASEGLEYADILRQLRVGLAWVERRQPFRSSLPAVVAELVRELGERPPDEEQEASLSPARMESLDALMAIFNQIPAPYRPRPEDRLRRVLVAALLELGDRAPLDQTFYEGLLATLFAWPLAEPVKRSLIAQSGEGTPLREAVRAASRDGGVLSREREDVLEQLMAIFNEIPAPYRPRPEDRLRHILTEALLADGPLDEAFHAGVLADLFSWPLAEPVKRFLLEATEEGSALRAAVLAASRDSRALSRERESALESMMAIFNEIPAPYRPRPEDRLRRILVEALLAAGDGPLDESFYGGVLAELFAWPLAETVTRFLLGATEEGNPLRAAVLSASRHERERGVRSQTADRRRREQWAAELSEEELQRMTASLAPRRHRELLSAAEVLAAAWRDTAPPGHPALTDRRTFWSFMLEFVTRNAPPSHSVEKLVAAFFEDAAARSLAVVPEAEAGERLLVRAKQLARAGGHVALAGIVHRDRRVLLAPWERARAPKRARRARKWQNDDAAVVEAKPIYIDNAGLILTAPFLPQFFKVLDVLEEHDDRRPSMRNTDAASRAVHLLQSLADGRVDTPEPFLVLNKILCGVATRTPVAREIEPSEDERELCTKILRSMLASWTAIAQTSVEGLQETFLRRSGKLTRIDEGWKLEVQRKTVDFLVDEVPWNHSVIFHRWMPQPLHITW